MLSYLLQNFYLKKENGKVVPVYLFFDRKGNRAETTDLKEIEPCMLGSMKIFPNIEDPFFGREIFWFYRFAEMTFGEDRLGKISLKAEIIPGDITRLYNTIESFKLDIVGADPAAQTVIYTFLKGFFKTISSYHLTHLNTSDAAYMHHIYCILRNVVSDMQEGKLLNSLKVEELSNEV